MADVEQKIKKIGTKKMVYDGLATKTSGGLRKDDLMINKRGKVVSKKKKNQVNKHHQGAIKMDLKKSHIIINFVFLFFRISTILILTIIVIMLRQLCNCRNATIDFMVTIHFFCNSACIFKADYFTFHQFMS